MPYVVRVERAHGDRATLAVTPEQPDCEPFHLDRGFAVGLLLPAAHALRWDPSTNRNRREPTGALGRVLEPDDLVELAAGGLQPERFVVSVTVTAVTSWPWDYGRPTPTATYAIRATDPCWLEHLEQGRQYVSHAYSEDGPIHV